MHCSKSFCCLLVLLLNCCVVSFLGPLSHQYNQYGLLLKRGMEMSSTSDAPKRVVLNEKKDTDNDHQGRKPEVMLCFDLGSTNIKCDVFACSWPLKRLSEFCAEKSHAPFKDGLADAEKLIEETDNLLDTVISKLRATGSFSIRSIGFCSFAMNLYGSSSEGKPITPCFTYASHQDEAQDVEKILRKVLSEKDHQRTGAVVHASYAIVQLKTYAETQRQQGGNTCFPPKNTAYDLYVEDVENDSNTPRGRAGMKTPPKDPLRGRALGGNRLGRPLVTDNRRGGWRGKQGGAEGGVEYTKNTQPASPSAPLTSTGNMDYGYFAKGGPGGQVSSSSTIAKEERRSSPSRTGTSVLSVEENIKEENVVMIDPKNVALVQDSYNLIPESLLGMSGSSTICGTGSECVFMWQTVAAGVMSKWTGQKHLPISISEASWTGMLDFRKNAWDPLMCELSEVDPSTLPALIGTETPLQFPFSQEVQEKWPELVGTDLFPCLGDGAAAALGSRCDDAPGRIALTIGTSCAARVVIPCTDVLQPPDSDFSSIIDPDTGMPLSDPERCLLPPRGLWCYRIDTKKVLVGGALTDGGALIAWLDGLIGPEKMKLAQEKLVEIMTAHDEGFLETAPMMLPFFSGERSTGWHTEAQGSLHGLTLNTTSPQILYSVYEGVAFRIKAILQQMNKGGLVRSASQASADPIIASGKGLSNVAWRQIIADVTGRAIIEPKLDGDAAGCGVARHMLCNMGLCTNKYQWGDESTEDRRFRVRFGFSRSEVLTVTEPNIAMRRFLKTRAERHTELYSLLHPQLFEDEAEMRLEILQAYLG